MFRLYIPPSSGLKEISPGTKRSECLCGLVQYKYQIVCYNASLGCIHVSMQYAVWTVDTPTFRILLVRYILS